MSFGTATAPAMSIIMTRNKASCRKLGMAALILASVFPGVARCEDSLVFQTNFVDKQITNTVEIRIPRNVFVTEFRTNEVEVQTTNLVTLYRTNVVGSTATNWETRYRTNEFTLNRIRTNSVDVYHTNWTGKTTTNLFLVSRYNTNVVDHYQTNTVQLFKTNWTLKRFTNETVLNLVETNNLAVYRTNWTQKYFTNEMVINEARTNFIERYQTNWTTRYVTNWTNRALTNEVAVNLFRTNLVDRYRTNLKTLNLTNWQTVVVTKTNRVTQPSTNFVQIDPPAGQNPGPSRDARAGNSVVLPGEEPIIEAGLTGRSSANNAHEVAFRIKWPAVAPEQVQHWWIEREDGAYLSVGQDREFKRQLPAGSYKVEAKVQHDADSAVLTLRGTVLVSAREVVVTQKPGGKKLAAN
jgi:hypothetical protein